MKKAKKYLGRKVLLEIDTGDTETSTSEKRNIVCEFDSFKEDVNNDMYTNIKLLEDNLELYKCDLAKTNKLDILYNIRKRWEKGLFNYREYLTKDEIVELLKNDYLVAVEGLQEIDLKDIEEL